MDYAPSDAPDAEATTPYTDSGEVELIGGDVAGMAVNIGACIAALAAPRRRLRLERVKSWSWGGAGLRGARPCMS